VNTGGFRRLPGVRERAVLGVSAESNVFDIGATGVLAAYEPAMETGVSLATKRFLLGLACLRLLFVIELGPLVRRFLDDPT